MCPAHPKADPIILEGNPGRESWVERVFLDGEPRPPVWMAWDLGVAADEAAHWWRLPDGTMVEKPAYIPAEWMDRITPEWGPDRNGVHRWHLMWTGWHNGKGHAKFSRAGKPTYCYRYIIEKVTGFILRRFDYVDHICERKPCLTFECLEVVSPKVNTERGPGMGFWFRPKS